MAINTASGQAGLTEHHILLLAAHYATEADIPSLRALVDTHPGLLPSELLLRCILTYVPETIDPERYVGLVRDIADGNLPRPDQSEALDTTSVQHLSAKRAQKRARELHLLPLVHHNFPASEYPEPVVQFVIHRAHRIDEETGLLTYLRQLAGPFVDKYPSLRVWFISCVLPLLRLEYDYYPRDERSYSLEQVELASDGQGVDIWLSRALEGPEGAVSTYERLHANPAADNHLARDLKCLVGPWMYGDRERKRRRLNRRASSENDRYANNRSESNTSEDISHGCDAAFRRILQKTPQRLPVEANAFDTWDGPSDMDLGGHTDSKRYPKEDEIRLTQRYVEAGFAALYNAEAGDEKTILAAYKIIARLSVLLGLDPVPNLQDQLQALFDVRIGNLHVKELSRALLDQSSLLEQRNPLTTEGEKSFRLARCLILSAKLLGDCGQPVSINGAARLRFVLDKDEQSNMLQKILHHLTTGTRSSPNHWVGVRRKLIWLWNWGNPDDGPAGTGLGLFGKMHRTSLEKDILEAMVSSFCKC